MTMTIVTAPRDLRAGRVPGALITGTGSVVVGTVNFGVVGMLFIVVATFIGLAVLFRVLLPLGRRRLYRRLPASSATFMARATHRGTAGVITISPDEIEFAEHRHRHVVTITKNRVLQAEVSPVSPLVSGTRLRLKLLDSDDVRFTITAANTREVEDALIDSRRVA
jgi:hypothetical protein